jgi:hypothetical protein
MKLRTLMSLLNYRSFTKNNINTQLGRWNLKYDEKTISKTVLLANEDNCGCCGYYEEKKQPSSDNYDTSYMDEITYSYHSTNDS